MRGRSGEQVILVGEVRKIKRERERIYDEEVKKELKKIWCWMDGIWGKRLAPALPWLVEKLEASGRLRVSSRVKKKLLSMTIETKVKRELRKRYAELDLAKIKRQMERIHDKLIRIQENKRNYPKFRVDLFVRGISFRGDFLGRQQGGRLSMIFKDDKLGKNEAIKYP